MLNFTIQTKHFLRKRVKEDKQALRWGRERQRPDEDGGDTIGASDRGGGKGQKEVATGAKGSQWSSEASMTTVVLQGGPTTL